VEVKVDPRSFAQRLVQSGCTTAEQDHSLVVGLPPTESLDLLWKVAAATGEQIRCLRPQKSTLEEVFLKALEEDRPAETTP
jgi:ABC-2 type transport system ATP-binding protein